jgi:hypothetical protein
MKTGLGLIEESLQPIITEHLSDISHPNLSKPSGDYVHTAVANPDPEVRSRGRVLDVFQLPFSPPPWILKSIIQNRYLCIIQYDDLTAFFKFPFEVHYHFIGSILGNKRTVTCEIAI